MRNRSLTVSWGVVLLFAVVLIIGCSIGRAAANESPDLVTVCHYDRNEGGPNAGPHTIKVAPEAVEQHLANHTRTNGHMGDDSLGVCPTPTNTATPTSTARATDTPTATATDTPTPRATDTPTPTNTATPIGALVPPVSETPVPTETATSRPTDRATPTPTLAETPVFLTGETTVSELLPPAVLRLPDTGANSGDLYRLNEGDSLPWWGGLAALGVALLTLGVVVFRSKDGG